jgi:plasmid stabilization system protein ParE
MMHVILHPAVQLDLLQIAEFYESVAGTELADDFYNELSRFIYDAAKNPEHFSVREHGLRRVNLTRFP